MLSISSVAVCLFGLTSCRAESIAPTVPDVTAAVNETTGRPSGEKLQALGASPDPCETLTPELAADLLAAPVRPLSNNEWINLGGSKCVYEGDAGEIAELRIDFHPLAVFDSANATLEALKARAARHYGLDQEVFAERPGPGRSMIMYSDASYTLVLLYTGFGVTERGGERIVSEAVIHAAIDNGKEHPVLRREKVEKLAADQYRALQGGQ